MNDKCTAPSKRRWFHSTNQGRTWVRIHPLPRSLVATLPIEPGEVYDDGFGNRYRYELAEAQAEAGAS